MGKLHKHIILASDYIMLIDYVPHDSQYVRLVNGDVIDVSPDRMDNILNTNGVQHYLPMGYCKIKQGEKESVGFRFIFD